MLTKPPTQVVTRMENVSGRSAWTRCHTRFPPIELATRSSSSWHRVLSRVLSAVCRLGKYSTFNNDNSPAFLYLTVQHDADVLATAERATRPRQARPVRDYGFRCRIVSQCQQDGLMDAKRPQRWPLTEQRRLTLPFWLETTG